MAHRCVKFGFRFSANAAIPVDKWRASGIGPVAERTSLTLFLIFRSEQAMEKSPLETETFSQRQFVR